MLCENSSTVKRRYHRFVIEKNYVRREIWIIYQKFKMGKNWLKFRDFTLEEKSECSTKNFKLWKKMVVTSCYYYLNQRSMLHQWIASFFLLCFENTLVMWRSIEIGSLDRLLVKTVCSAQRTQEADNSKLD